MNLFLQEPPRKAWLVGHRGAMGHAPENTLASFEKGLAMGADWVECDIHLSRDGKCVVMHDEAVERTTDGRGLIRDLRASRIRKLDAGSWLSRKFRGERVPLLEDLLRWASRRTTRRGLPLGVVIEVKNEPVRYLGIERRAIQTILKCGMEDRAVLISFDHGVVKRAKALRRSLAAGLLYSRPLENPVLRARQTNADALFPRRHLVTPSLVRKARRAGLPVATWTVDDPPEMRKLLRCGVHAMTSNFPDKLDKVLKAQR